MWKSPNCFISVARQVEAAPSPVQPRYRDSRERYYDRFRTGTVTSPERNSGSVRLPRCRFLDHLPAHRAYIAGDVPEMRSVSIDWQLALNEREVVDAADGRMRVLFPEA